MPSIARFCHWPNSVGLISNSWQTCELVRRSLQIDNTAVIFCCGSNTLRGRWLVFMIYILSCVVHKFFFPAGGIVVHQHFDFTFFSPDDHALATHAAHHIKWIYRTPAKRQFQNVLRNAFLQCLFQIVGDLEKPVGRAQAADALVRATVIVILDPKMGSLHRLIEAVELGTLEKFVLDRLPKSFYFPKRHRVMGTGADVLHTVFFHLPFEAGLAAPVRVLTSIVGEHLFGNTVLGNAAAIGLEHVGGRLAAIQPKGGNVTAVVIHEADQVGVAPRQPESHDIALPQLVGTGSFEEPGFGWILYRLALGLVYKPFLGQRLMYG